jgi:hypothetical protein
MRIDVATLGVLLLFPLAAQAQSNPYVLQVDRAPYALRVPSAGVARPSAAGGASVDARAPLQQQATAARAPESDPIVRQREQHYEHQLRELVRERDAWKLRADSLEAELRLSRGHVPPTIYPLPARP